MTPTVRRGLRAPGILGVLGCLVAALPHAAHAQVLITACYSSPLGIVYRTGAPGSPARCVGNSVPFNWTDLGSVAGGDLTGTLPNPKVSGLQGRPLAATAPATGQVLSWDGAKWTPVAPPSGGVTAHGALTGLTNDDHPQYLLTNGVRSSTGFAVTGTLGGSIPATGPGVRLMWYPGKAAFRAGEVTTEWDDAQVGSRSTGLGQMTTASGQASTALGQSTVASGVTSTAMGGSATASGVGATAMGLRSSASGRAATASGELTIASGDFSTAQGTNSQATGAAATASGSGAVAGGQSSTASGAGATASGDFSVALGSFTAASGRSATALGENTAATAAYTLACCVNATAGNQFAVVLGSGSTASGWAATALGNNATASGDYSTAIGFQANTNGMHGSTVIADAQGGPAVNATATNSFVVRAQHVWFGSSGDQVATAGRYLETSTGAYLSDGGAWTNASSRKLKDDFRPVDADSVLERLRTLPVSSWHYRAESSAVRHLGPTAEEFRAAFGLGDGGAAIATVDIDGVNMIAIQALERRTRELQARLEQREAEIRELRARLDDLARRLDH